MGEMLGYLGTLAVVVLASITTGAVAFVFVTVGLGLLYMLPQFWLDHQFSPNSPGAQAAQDYVMKSCLVWGRIAFALGVFYVLTEGCRDEVQRLLGPLLRLVDSL